MADYYEELSVGAVRSREQIINLGAYWKDVRMEYSAGSIIYKGCHYSHNVATTDANWSIWKYSWSGDDLIRIEGPLPGSWDGRAALNWGV